MSFMSVPALDRLLEPSSEIESTTSKQSWSARAERRTAINMSPLFPSQPHSQPSPPQARISPPPFSPSPYVLNFKRRVFEGPNDDGAKAANYVSMPSGRGQLREETSSIRGESEIAASNSKTVLNNEDGVLPVREVQDRLSLGGSSFEGRERFPVNSVGKVEKMMSNLLAKSVEAKDNGRWQRESGRGESRSRNSFGRQDSDFSSVSSSNREEFFDAPEEPFDDISSDEESLRAQRTARSKPGGRRDVDENLKSLLDQEIKRRMAAEDAMAVLQLQCTEMASHLDSVDEDSRSLNDSDGDDRGSDSLAQRLVVAQVVSYSVARGAARAEVDEEMENVVVEKNREISRLRDKLHYYELVNHEMSQRNQEAFELARTRRHVRRNRNQWLVVCAGSALCVGVSALLVRKFIPWASAQFPARGILPSHIRTDTFQSAPSHDV